MNPRLRNITLVGMLAFAGPIFLKNDAAKRYAHVENEEFSRQILLGEPIDVLDDPITLKTLQNRLVQDLQKSYPHYLAITVDKIEGKNYLVPYDEGEQLPTNVDRQWRRVRDELTSLGVETEYQLVAVRNASDLHPEENQTRENIYLAKMVGTRYDYSLRVTVHDGTEKTLEWHVDKVSHGVVPKQISTEGDHVMVEPGEIIVATHHATPAQLYTSLFSETLHHYLSPQNKVLIEFLSQQTKKDGVTQWHYFEYSRAVSQLTEEAVVHGLARHWLQENQRSFGLTDEDLSATDEPYLNNIIYRGVAWVNEWAGKEGRVKILHEYRENPAFYWGLLQARIPEYRTLLSPQ